MMVLFMKRLESSWLSCLNTMEKVLLAHETALATVTDYLNDGQDGTISVEGNDDEEEDEDFSIGKGYVQLAQMGERVYDYQIDLEQDIRALKYFVEQLRDFKKGFEAGTEKDEKLEKLKAILSEKAKKENKKVVIFTAYSDTANYLYEQLTKAGLRKIACVTGTESKADGKTTKDFTKILERFAPYSKLYLEQDWSTLYDEMGLDREMYYDAQKHRWNVDYETWKETIAAAAESEKDEMGCREQAKEAQETIAQEIDILIATDCLSEGQNLQDADTVVNYDIHWNPVRLIQRFGRIDRLKSPNKEIYMINLWPKQAMNDYIKIEERISHRMALMSVGGSETIKGTTSSYDTIMKDNPIAGKQVQKTLDRIAKGDKIEDIEDDSSTLSFATLSADAFRQDLSLYLEKNKEQLLRMPNGVYSGFRLMPCSNGTKEPTESDPKSKYSDTPESIVALVGTPHRDPEHADRPYERLYLMLQPIGQAPQFKNLKKEGILGLLSQYKTASREVPQVVEAMAPQEIALLKQCLQDALMAQCEKTGEQNMMDDLCGAPSKDTTAVNGDNFRLEDYDLIAWEYISAAEAVQTSKESEA